MSATTIFFNGRLISVPGSYTEVDASGLEALGLGASGIVALLGTSIGGKPWNAVDEGDVKGNLQVSTRPSNPRTFFKSGDQLEAAAFLFGPSSDSDIPAGAQEVVHVKTNPAAQSAASFDNSDGQSLIYTSKDWGFDTTQISAEIATGTTQGKLLTITFEATVETFDDVGGDNIFTLQYAASAPAEGFTTLTAEIDAARIKTLFTRDQTGLDGDVTNQVTPTQIIEMLSDNVADTAVQVRVYGTDTSDQTQTEVVILDGTTPVPTVSTWNSYHGHETLPGPLPLGTITLRNDGGGTTIATGNDAGVEFTVDHAISNSVVSVVLDAAGTERATLFGLSNLGVFQTEVFVLNGATPVVGVALWSRIDGLGLGEVPGARTFTLSGTSVDAPYAGLATIQKQADKFNGTPGYTFTVVVTNPVTFLAADLDFQGPTDVKGPATMSALGDLAAIISKLTAESQLVTPSKGSVASGPPDNTTAPVFLTGGHEGSAVPGQEGVVTATFADWQGALDLLKKVRVNSVCAITSDPAVHAAVDAHCTFMAGVGRSERDSGLGAENAAQDNVPTKTEYKAQAVDLGSRHVRLFGQAIERFDSKGERREFGTPFQACVVIGMQAGSPVGTSMTHKFANVLKLRQDSSWNPVDDAEELIQAGLCFMEVVDGIGRRVVRNVTTHLSSSNIAFTEASVNEAVNFSVFNFRTAMETFVGARGFSGTANAAKGLAVNQLGLLVGVSLVTWRSLDIQLVLDVLEIAVEISPVLPVNFVKSTMHLVAIPQSAAA